MRHGWEYKKLGEVASYINGFAFKPEQWTIEGVPIIRIQNLNNPDAPFNHYDGDVPDKVKVTKGDLLISWSATLGTYIWEGGDAYLNQHIFKVEFDKGDIDKMYLKYAVSSKLDAMANLVHGATMKHIVKKDFDNTRIPVPPLSVQKQICSLLDNLNLVIEKKKQQIEELDNLTQSLFFDMFGDPVANDKGWSIDRLEANCEVSSAKRVLVEDVVESGIPFLRGTELTALSKSVSSKNVTFTMFITPEHYERVKAVTGVPKKGDILIPSINSEGITWVVDTDEPFYFKDGRVIWVHVNTNVFVSQYLSSAITRILKANYSLLTSGATFLELKLFIIRDLLVPIPPLPLQQAFAEKVKAIEQQKELINQSIKDVQTLFDAKMDYYFGD